MKYLRSYLWDHRKLLLALPVLGAVAAVLFALYDLPAPPLLYTGLVCAVMGLCCFVIPDFAAYRRRVKDLETLKSNILTTLELPELFTTLPEKKMEETLRLLRDHLWELETSYAAKHQDMLEYYTLWGHQIKTPLSAIRLILQSQPGQQSEPLMQELFKVERYVEMVLGYLRLDSMSSDLRLERCSVHQIVRQAVKKFTPQFIYNQLSLDLQDFDNRVITDEKWLLFVLEQLLSNAVKYTPSGGVTISMNERDVLIIRDTGVGISPEDLPRIFERGFTGANGRLDKTSTGLGLYLVKQILDRLQNRIEIESQPGKGTEVRLYLHRAELKAY